MRVLFNYTNFNYFSNTCWRDYLFLLNHFGPLSKMNFTHPNTPMSSISRLCCSTGLGLYPFTRATPSRLWWFYISLQNEEEDVFQLSSFSKSLDYFTFLLFHMQFGISWSIFTIPAEIFTGIALNGLDQLERIDNINNTKYSYLGT